MLSDRPEDRVRAGFHNGAVMGLLVAFGLLIATVFASSVAFPITALSVEAVSGVELTACYQGPARPGEAAPSCGSVGRGFIVLFFAVPLGLGWAWFVRNRPATEPYRGGLSAGFAVVLLVLLGAALTVE